ncbi:hypothetical protein K450DRAFT_243621 [Umbelopsis ramanniana AG]|uniref:LsmAD domain-containing protein n=1 Tax=Umbelopsis ramanniana AG TaxID=1314678 RepID=A0AAD5E9B2_UMBRA|nr:uncharacterized protein K450DRAFT_243621 [Umbelopsis ramanniana AG]KAI8579049.1 hypothetical protein K450DRAFT_243621 [Umbelopsis ramanniana AG]
MAFNNVKQQGKKQDMPFQKQNTSRGGGKKWNNNGPGGSRASSLQGSGSNNTSGHSSPVSPAPSSPSIADSRPNTSGPSESDAGSHHMHDRMLFLLANLVGLNVQVKTKDGTEFEGLFHAATTSSELAIVLKLARKIHKASQKTAETDKTNPNATVTTMIIQAKDLIEITAVDVDFNAATKPLVDKDTFKTDVDISGRGSDIRERELHRWNPEVHSSDDLKGLEDADTFGDTTTVNWDQFAANEKLFGLKTNFDEEIYTTRLDRSAPDYKTREKRAAEMAAEIQKSASTNVHVMEERGAQMDDSGMDEEDRYGAVVRDINPNKYMPPALRKQMQQQKQAGKTDTASGSESPDGKSDSKKTRSDNPLQKLSTSNLPKTGASPSPVSNLGNMRSDAAGVRGKVSANNKGGDNSQNRKPIEAEIANTFRQFAMVEKDKLNAKKQALQKKEKDGRLADLMKFHQTFKLNVPVPPDLVPLLKPKSTSSFKFNVKASEFKPNPSAPAFVPGGAAKASNDLPGSKKQHVHVSSLTLTEAFVPPSAKDKHVKPDSVGPTWPYGSKSYTHQMHQYSGYEEDVYQGASPQNYPYNYPYRYAQYVPGMPPVPVQQPGMSYMNPQFVTPNMAYSTGGMPNAAPSFSPQMANVPARK